jgi:hypothetical protein
MSEGKVGGSFPYHDVLVVEPSGLDGADEELAAVGVGTSVGCAMSKPEVSAVCQ